MAKTDRLFRLIAALRRGPAPVTAARLARELEVSTRTLYRDIETLRAGGALIDGEAGLGYTLTEDPALPPQSFTRLEIEALVLGLGEAAFRGDRALGHAALSALDKITATLPDRQQRQVAHSVAMVHRLSGGIPRPPTLPVLREASWDERAVDITFWDRDEVASERRVWPLAIVYTDARELLLAWCTLRQDFRTFRTDRITRAEITDESFRPRRAGLLRDYVRGFPRQNS